MNELRDMQMVKRSILSDAELVQGAQAIADDIRVGGSARLMLARVIDDHLGWFEKARARGLAWTDIIDVLSRAGVNRPDGRPLSRGHLSSLVWRKQKSATETGPAPMTPPASEATGAKPKGLHSPAPSKTKRSGGSKPTNSGESHPAPAPSPTANSAATPHDAETEGKMTGRSKMLAYMRRSARARGGL